MMNVNAQFVPVGTVIAYAGEVKDQYEQLEKAGWLVCDGRELESENYQELSESIGTAFGTTAKGLFNIPDLRGLFIRCVTGASPTDPDAAVRVALLNGGNAGNMVGSYQPYATAKPNNPFTATISNNNIVSRSLDSGCDTASSGTEGASDTGGQTNGSGGALETRPKNKYVFFLIKKSSLNQYREDVTLPIGSIIPFSGPPNLRIEQEYIACKGEAISGLGKFKALFEVIQYIHGKANDGNFYLPDYRGYFLRGVDDQAPGSRRDPEADLRTPPFPAHPKGDQGNAGNNVGSVQDDATAYPVSAGFFTTIPRLPVNEGNQAISGSVKSSFNWNSGAVTAVVTQGGGDTETRPVNFSVDWYIKFK